jgi:hypothetical protein
MSFNPKIVKNDDRKLRTPDVLNEDMSDKQRIKVDNNIKYTKMQGPQSKVEYARKGDDCIFQVFPNNQAPYSKKNAMRVIMTLEKMFPRDIKCRIIPPTPAATWYTIYVVDIYKAFGDLDRQVKKMATALGRVKFRYEA